MRAGKMRDRIELQRPSQSTGDEWGPGSGFTSEGSVWAEVTPVSGTEKQAGDAVQATVTHQIKIRYLASVTSQWRAVYRGRVLDFMSVLDADGRGRELRIEAREHKVNG